MKLSFSNLTPRTNVVLALCSLVGMAAAACGRSASPNEALPPAPASDAGAEARAALPLDLPTQSDIADLVKPLVDGRYMGAFVVGLIDATGEVVYGYGKTSKGAAPDGDTVFEIGSVTKSFTALWLASQVGSGVTLDDPVSMYLPSNVVVPSRNGKQITLGALAAHTSGLPRLPSNFVPANPNDPYADYRVADLYAFLGSHALTVDPGTKYEYSNVGAGLLGHALTRHAGGTYEANIATAIGAPLGLVDTAVKLSAAQMARLATGHDGDLRAAEAWTATNAIEGAGQLHSTAHDLLKLVSAEVGLTDTTLAPAIALTQTRAATDAARRGVGLGWVLESHGGMWHNGQTGGYASFVGFDPKTKLGVVVLSDTACLYTTELGIALLERLEGKKAMLSLPPSVTLSDEELERFAGTYALASGPLVVTLKEHELSATGILREPVRLYPSSPTEFSLRRLAGSVVFSSDSATLQLDGSPTESGPKK
jgi:serine-type D-Ala-D-Ala carboxypeptidase/endopeptidase